MTYSFVVPIYNDAYLAEDFCLEFKRVFVDFLNRQEIDRDVELIFVDDGSSDNSADTLVRIGEAHKFVKVIELSRNFGQHVALSCGYEHASGKYVGMLNVDMQDPPSEIPLLLNAMQAGAYDIIHGLYKKRRVKFRERVTSALFNYVLNKLTGYDTPMNIATLRIMNRKFVEAYNSLTEKSRYIPGLEMWLGFKRGYVEIDHRERTKGSSSYNFRKRVKMALETIFSFSDLPIRIVVYFGGIMMLVGFLLIIFMIVQKLFFIDYLPGYVSTISLIIFVGGLQMLFLGTASLYIGKILKEVQNRPMYIIRNKYYLE